MWVQIRSIKVALGGKEMQKLSLPPLPKWHLFHDTICVATWVSMIKVIILEILGATAPPPSLMTQESGTNFKQNMGSPEHLLEAQGHQLQDHRSSQFTGTELYSCFIFSYLFYFIDLFFNFYFILGYSWFVNAVHFVLYTIVDLLMLYTLCTAKWFSYTHTCIYSFSKSFLI